MSRQLYLLAAGWLLLPMPASAQRTIEIVDTTSIDSHVSNFWSRVPATMSLRNGVLSFAVSNETIWASSEAHDWGSWAADGSENPDDATVLVNRALVLLPEGCQWEASGSAAVLSAAAGAAAEVLSSSAQVSMRYPDGSAFSWFQGSSVLVPALAKSISISGSGPDEIVSIVYEGSSSDPDFALFSCDTYYGSFTVVTNAVWTQLDDGTRRVQVPTGGASMRFYRAQVSREIPAHFQFSAPVVLSGGIKLYGEDMNGVLYDSIITVTNNTGVYMLPAQKVD